MDMPSASVHKTPPCNRQTPDPSIYCTMPIRCICVAH